MRSEPGWVTPPTLWVQSPHDPRRSGPSRHGFIKDHDKRFEAKAKSEVKTAMARTLTCLLTRADDGTTLPPITQIAQYHAEWIEASDPGPTVRAALGPLAPQRSTNSQRRFPMTEQPFRVGFIGAGRPWKSEGATGFGMAYQHADGYVRTGRCELAAVSDLNARECPGICRQIRHPQDLRRLPDHAGRKEKLEHGQHLHLAAPARGHDHCRRRGWASRPFTARSRWRPVGVRPKKWPASAKSAASS